MNWGDDPAAGGGPLAGVRVLDLTSVLMGPFATQLLGDMGADVIKVESPSGDTSRGIGPMRNPGMGPGFIKTNRNKRGIVLDLKQDSGREVLLRLVKDADILVYNIRPAAMKRLRLGWDDLASINPRLIHAGVFGYDQEGPYADWPAYDDLIQGAAGVPSLLARITDGTPRYAPLVFVDRAVGASAVNAITAALYQRERTGRGQSLEIPMFETILPFVMGEHMAGATFDPPLGPYGYSRLLAPDRRPYATQDGYVCALLYTDAHWKRFYEMTGRADQHASDERVKNISARTQYMSELCADNARFFATDTTASWMQRLKDADIPCMQLNSPETLMQDPHLQATQYFQRVQHPSEGAHWQMRPAARSSEAPRAQMLHAPRKGQHTRDVLAQAGYSDEEIETLIASGAAQAEPPQSH